MQMRRTITSIFLALALLLLPLTDRAQQSPPDKPQASSPEAKPQAPAPAQSAAPKQEPAQQSDQTIKTVVNLVDVLFTVLNRRNKLVPELAKSDFKIWDDKAPQEIRYFSKQTDLPLRIGMLLDTSNSIRDRIKFEQDASINFLFSVLRRNKDEAFVMTSTMSRKSSRASPAMRERCATRSPRRARAVAPQSTTRFMKRA